jgi:hypothetical protein
MARPRDIDARKFARVAILRLDEAKLIYRKAQLPAAAQYIGGYAVECVLKALVIASTPRNERPPSGDETIAWLKKAFGHDLYALKAYLTKRGVQMSHPVSGDFLFVSTWDPQLRYELGPGDPKVTERFLEAAEALVKWADERM